MSGPDHRPNLRIRGYRRRRRSRLPSAAALEVALGVGDRLDQPAAHLDVLRSGFSGSSISSVMRGSACRLRNFARFVRVGEANRSWRVGVVLEPHRVAPARSPSRRSGAEVAEHRRGEDAGEVVAEFDRHRSSQSHAAVGPTPSVEHRARGRGDLDRHGERQQLGVDRRVPHRAQRDRRAAAVVRGRAHELDVVRARAGVGEVGGCRVCARRRSRARSRAGRRRARRSRDSTPRLRRARRRRRR